MHHVLRERGMRAVVQGGSGDDVPKGHCGVRQSWKSAGRLRLRNRSAGGREENPGPVLGPVAAPPPHPPFTIRQQWSIPLHSPPPPPPRALPPPTAFAMAGGRFVSGIGAHHKPPSRHRPGPGCVQKGCECGRRGLGRSQRGPKGALMGPKRCSFSQARSPGAKVPVQEW